jgi:GH35 family endo-1,4-beta-xylanase
VTVVLGPKLLNCDYLIDNISLKYKYKPTYQVEKTEEEKYQIISGALNDYITAAMEAAPSIDSWAVADCPVTSASDLIWKQTMGDTYFGNAAQMMREQRPDAKLFVSEYLMDADVRATFLHLLNANAVGMNQINGIDAIVSVDAATFDAQAFATMLTELAATGRQIRLTIQNVTGSSDAEAAQALAQVVTAYRQKVQGAQQYGINFTAVTESANNKGLWTTGFNRKLSYASLADALQK